MKGKAYNNKFDYLIPDVTKTITDAFMKKMVSIPELQGAVDTSPLMNMMVGSYLSSLNYSLEVLKRSTIGEAELLSNIQLMQNKIIKLFSDLHFVKGIEWVDWK